MKKYPCAPDPSEANTSAATTSDATVFENNQNKPRNPERRKLLGQMLLGSVSLAAAGTLGSHEEKVLAARQTEEAEKNDTAKPDAVSGATRRHTNWSKLEDLKEKPPKGKIGKLKLSRIVLGGNLIGGWAHSRDLIYVSDLVKAYHTKEKIFATFKLAEACGITTFITNPILCEIMDEYWDKASGAIDFISDCGGDLASLEEQTQRSIDVGAAACYIHGGLADYLAQQGNFDPIAKTLEQIRKNGLPAGIGGHYLSTIQKCVDAGLKPDFWMKTLHHKNYWSAHPEQEECDNIFCREPEDTIAYMESRPEPWIAFKVLAAGAIQPADGFRYAYEAGADFICVGMYDFQIVDDVNIAVDILKSPLNRKREWIS
ncbi:MAG: hypothetical protein ACRC2T_18315 [Thermoguttaceae bacterium]